MSLVSIKTASLSFIIFSVSYRGTQTSTFYLLGILCFFSGFQLGSSTRVYSLRWDFLYFISLRILIQHAFQHFFIDRLLTHIFLYVGRQSVAFSLPTYYFTNTIYFKLTRQSSAFPYLQLRFPCLTVLNTRKILLRSRFKRLLKSLSNK